MSDARATLPNFQKQKRQSNYRFLLDGERVQVLGSRHKQLYIFKNIHIVRVIDSFSKNSGKYHVNSY